MSNQKQNQNGVVENVTENANQKEAIMEAVISVERLEKIISDHARCKSDDPDVQHAVHNTVKSCTNIIEQMARIELEDWIARRNGRAVYAGFISELEEYNEERSGFNSTLSRALFDHYKGQEVTRVEMDDLTQDRLNSVFEDLIAQEARNFASAVEERASMTKQASGNAGSRVLLENVMIIQKGEPKEHERVSLPFTTFVTLVDRGLIAPIDDTARAYGVIDVRDVDEGDLPIDKDVGAGIREVITEEDFYMMVTDGSSSEIIKRRADNAISFNGNLDFYDAERRMGGATNPEETVNEQEAPGSTYNFRTTVEQQYYYRKYKELMNAGFSSHKELYRAFEGILYPINTEEAAKRCGSKVGGWALPVNALSKEMRDELKQAYFDIAGQFKQQVKSGEKVIKKIAKVPEEELKMTIDELSEEEAENALKAARKRRANTGSNALTRTAYALLQKKAGVRKENIDPLESELKDCIPNLNKLNNESDQDRLSFILQLLTPEQCRQVLQYARKCGKQGERILSYNVFKTLVRIESEG